MSFKETGRMTLTMFNKMYRHYKDNFDVEMRLKNRDVTYSEAWIQSQRDEEWF